MDAKLDGCSLAAPQHPEGTVPKFWVVVQHSPHDLRDGQVLRPQEDDRDCAQSTDVGRDIPPYFWPSTALSSLEDVSEGMFLSVGGLLDSVSPTQNTSQGCVQTVTLSDGQTRLSGVKLWKGLRADQLKLVSVSDRSHVVLLQQTSSMTVICSATNS